jgi:hypothetical protein
MPPPKRAAITEWDNLEKAEAFFKSKAWNDLGPERGQGAHTPIRSRSCELGDLRLVRALRDFCFGIGSEHLGT